MEQHGHTEEAVRANIERLMQHDPNTVEVIAAMRSQGRTWSRIALCFRKQIAEMIDHQPK